MKSHVENASLLMQGKLCVRSLIESRNTEEVVKGDIQASAIASHVWQEEHKINLTKLA